MTKFLTIFSFSGLIYLLFFTPPNSIFKVFLFNLFLSLFFYQILIKKYLPKNFSLFFGFLFFMLITARSLKLVDYFNFIMLFLFLLGIFFLIK